MVPILLVLLLILILFGLGFVVKILWWVALVVLAFWVVGFLLRSANSAAGRGRSRWYRW